MAKDRIKKIAEDEWATLIELVNKSKGLALDEARKTLLGKTIRLKKRESMAIIPPIWPEMLCISLLLYDKTFITIDGHDASSEKRFKKEYGMAPNELAMLAAEQRVIPVIDFHESNLREFDPKILEILTSEPFTTDSRLLAVNIHAIKNLARFVKYQGYLMHEDMRKDIENLPSDKKIRKKGKFLVKIEMSNGNQIVFDSEALSFLSLTGIDIEDIKWILDMERKAFGDESQGFALWILGATIPTHLHAIGLGAVYQAQTIPEVLFGALSTRPSKVPLITLVPFHALNSLFSRLGLLYSPEIPFQAYVENIVNTSLTFSVREIVRDAICEGTLTNESRLHEFASSINQDILDLVRRRTPRIKLLYCLCDLSFGFLSDIIHKLGIPSVRERTKYDISEFLFEKSKTIISKLLGKRPYVVQLNRTFRHIKK